MAWRELLRTEASGWTILIRLLVGLVVFFPEGIQKLAFPDILGRRPLVSRRRSCAPDGRPGSLSSPPWLLGGVIMTERIGESRRRILLGAMGLGGTTMLAGGSHAWAQEKEEKEKPVTPAEDLMREHGVLERLLLIYEAGLSRIERGEPVQAEILHRAAGIVSSFVESYHERLEEDFVFPRLRKAGRLVDLVDVLTTQHARGRAVTAAVLERTADAAALDAAGRSGLARLLRQYIAMYRPHAAREDTVLFPAFKALVPAKDYAELGERFEEIEHESFGENGFDKIVGQVAEFERAYGIHDLSRFTPPEPENNQPGNSQPAKDQPGDDRPADERPGSGQNDTDL